jgi:hypothetical protein
MDDQDFGPYVSRLFQIESGGDPRAQTGSNRGLAQFGTAEEQQYGISDANRTDPNAQAAAVEREARAHSPILAKVLGRDPTPGELYLMHQQGIAGAPALLKNPDQPAWQAVRPFYKSDAVAKLAISGNTYKDAPFYRADPDTVKAGDFSNYWVNKFENRSGGAPAAVAAQSSATAPALAMASLPASSGAPSPASPAAEEQLEPPAQQEEQQQQPAPASPSMLQPPPMPAMVPPSAGPDIQRLRAAIMARQQAPQRAPLPPSVAQRIAALMGRTG